MDGKGGGDEWQSLRDRFCRKTWSPWVCGVLMGLASVACMALCNHRLGAVGGFETLASMIAAALGIAEESTYFSVVRPPRIDERFLVYGGIVIGALIGAVSSGSFKVQGITGDSWRERFGGSVAERWASMFGGCMLVALGAGIAGGCTSGLGVSGIMQLAPAGVVFFAGAFAAGIAVDALIYRGRDGR